MSSSSLRFLVLEICKQFSKKALATTQMLKRTDKKSKQDHANSSVDIVRSEQYSLLTEP